MFAYVKKSLGIVHVTQTPTYVIIEGVDVRRFADDVYKLWGTSTLMKYMFQSTSSKLKFRHFFALDVKYIFETIIKTPRMRFPKRIAQKVIDELLDKTWLGTVQSMEKNQANIVDTRGLDKLVPFQIKPYQMEFIRHYGHIVPTFRLKGYMLDAAPGTGKTVTGLLLGEALKVDHVIVVAPLNSVNRVWEDTINNIMTTGRSYWVSTDRAREPSLDDHYYVVHYDRLEQIFDFVKHNEKNLGNVLVWLDESHNFNRQAALRTQMFIDMCSKSCVKHVCWASGTPIMALGNECIPFLKTVDPFFDQESEEAFRKIYGRDAKRANDILRNRIGHMKFYVAKQEATPIVPIVSTLKVKIPNGLEYTLDAIRAKMTSFIAQRTAYYNKHKHEYVSIYEKCLELFEKTLRSYADQAQYKTYRSYIKQISSGYDPETMQEQAKFCNNYELRTIIPTLPADLKQQFKGARSVVKYVNLKIMGEALGGVLGKARSQCHVDMAKHIDIGEIVDNSEKKTLIFTSFVEVVETLRDKVIADGYTPAVVYGSTNKDLPKIVSAFYKNEDVNPLIATYQSLSTAVPLTAANTIVMINQPFRSGIREQTIARAARLGQDKDVHVIDVLLDTGDLANISTRTNDIMQWSQEQVASILGVKNVDVDSLSLEMGDLLESVNEAGYPNPGDILYVPANQTSGDIRPRLQVDGELRQYSSPDDTNAFILGCIDEEDAVLRGMVESLHQKYEIDHIRIDKDRMHIDIMLKADADLSIQEVMSTAITICVVRGSGADWGRICYIDGLGNGVYKTRLVKQESIISRDTDNISYLLKDWGFQIHRMDCIEAFESAVGADGEDTIIQNYNPHTGDVLYGEVAALFRKAVRNPTAENLKLAKSSVAQWRDIVNYEFKPGFVDCPEAINNMRFGNGVQPTSPATELVEEFRKQWEFYSEYYHAYRTAVEDIDHCLKEVMAIWETTDDKQELIDRASSYVRNIDYMHSVVGDSGVRLHGGIVTRVDGRSILEVRTPAERTMILPTISAETAQYYFTHFGNALERVVRTPQVVDLRAKYPALFETQDSYQLGKAIDEIHENLLNVRSHLDVLSDWLSGLCAWIDASHA